ncbi:MAG TPA: inositol monophosphatase family protein, partial [Actinoplanes sp.]
ARARPRDAVLGEEFGVSEAAAGHGTRRWVIDPIDGTKNFVRGVPVWATLIALLEGDTPVAGLVSAPALGRRWWGATGLGAYAGKHQRAATRIHVSGVRELADASFCYASLSGWADRGLLRPVVDLSLDAWRSRAYGDFYGYMLLAEGALDVMIEAELSLWDVAALIPIIQEAGGRITDLGGRPAGDKTSSIATNGLLHETILTALTR